MVNDRPTAARQVARIPANDNQAFMWGDEWDELRVFVTPGARARLDAACGDRAIATAGWSDAHVDRFLYLLGIGHCQRDAAAIVNGDALLEEDGRVNHDPGCSWIDSALR